MTLDFINQPLRYDKILTLLGTTPYGTVANHVTRLATLGLTVVYTEGTLADLWVLLDQNLPVIALVRTGELSYWTYDTMHTILLVGYDADHIYANDPYFETAPVTISTDEFDLAWLEMGNRYAVISP
jgi:hypothetical protein